MNRMMGLTLFICLALSIGAQQAPKVIDNDNQSSGPKTSTSGQTTVGGTQPQSTSAPGGAVQGDAAAQQLLDRAIAAFGTMAKLKSIRATRQTWTVEADTHYYFASERIVGEEERIISYPDRLYLRVNMPMRRVIIVTPQSATVGDGRKRSELSPEVAENYRAGMRFSIPYVAQHRSEFTFSSAGPAATGTEVCDYLRVRRKDDGTEQVWCIDEKGRVLIVSGRDSFGDFTTRFSDFRVVDGVNIPFHRKTSARGMLEVTVKKYEINPPDEVVNAAMSGNPTP